MGAKLTNEEVQRRISKFFEQNVILKSNYISKRENITLECLDCGHQWETVAGNVLYIGKSANANSHHCPNCGFHKKTKIEKKCAYCGKIIYRYPSDIEKNISGYFYCSRECGNKHKNKIREENGEWDNSISSYRSRALKVYEHKCLCCGWNEDPRILEVHHIDENRNNNRLDNLCILCPTCHRKITLGYYILDLENKELNKI